MRKRNLCLLGTVMFAGACAPAAGNTIDEDAAREEFDPRASEVADGWPKAEKKWPAETLMLDNPVVWDGYDKADTSAQAAFDSGWYEAPKSLPKSAPDAKVSTSDGTEKVETWDAERGLAKLASGGKPPQDCPTQEPSPSSSEGDDSDSATSAQAVCGTLTITKVEAGEDERWTSRGMATVPVWLYTVEGHAKPISQLAYPISQKKPVSVDVPDIDEFKIHSARQLQSLSRDEITYTITANGCSYHERPLVLETDQIIVEAGIADKKAGTCTMEAGASPVTERLDEPLGDRMIVDAVSGAVLNHQDPFPQPPHNYDAGTE